MSTSCWRAPFYENEPIFGDVWLLARMATERDTRMVRFMDIKVPRIKFRGATKKQEGKLTALERLKKEQASADDNQINRVPE